MVLFSIICFWGALGGFGWMFEADIEKINLINQIHNLNLELIDLTGNHDLIINKLNNQILDINHKYSMLEKQYSLLQLENKDWKERWELTDHSLKVLSDMYDNLMNAQNDDSSAD